MEAKFLIIKIIMLLIVKNCTQMANSKIRKNELTVKIIPSLVEDDAHTYHMLAYCTGKRGLIYTENGCSKGIQIPTAKNNWRHVFDEVAKLEFNDTQQCVAYNIHIWLKLKEDQHWVSWPTSYDSEIENNLLNHRVLFGNHFYLTISPEMDSNSEHFYSIQVYCEEKTVENQQHQQMVDGKTGPTNSDKNWPMNDENDKYNFKTYTKRSTMVVFNSEARQCTDSNTYRIKVWAVHKQLLYFNPSGPPLLNYVCKSNGNSERRHISFLNQFDLQIVPTIPKDDDSIYYVETQCHNKGNEHQTFKSVTSGSIKIVLHKFACKSYDITARKVPKNWTQQIELYKYAIRQIKDATELNVNIDNGYVYIFDYETLVRTNRRWRNAGPSSNANLFDLNVEDYVASDYDKMEEEDRKETELNKARMDETDDDCFYYFN